MQKNKSLLKSYSTIDYEYLNLTDSEKIKSKTKRAKFFNFLYSLFYKISENLKWISLLYVIIFFLNIILICFSIGSVSNIHQIVFIFGLFLFILVIFTSVLRYVIKPDEYLLYDFINIYNYNNRISTLVLKKRNYGYVVEKKTFFNYYFITISIFKNDKLKSYKLSVDEDFYNDIVVSDKIMIKQVSLKYKYFPMFITSSNISFYRKGKKYNTIDLERV